jgi:CHAD domain-containing protein
VIATLVEVQDHLGALQDTVVALQTVSTLRADHPDDVALAVYGRALTVRRDELQATFAPLWQRISGAPFRRDLASLVAAL